MIESMWSRPHLTAEEVTKVPAFWQNTMLVIMKMQCSNGTGFLYAHQRHDVISGVDGLSISNDGRVRRDGMSPLDFTVMFSLKLVGERISLVMCDCFLSAIMT